MDKYTLLHIQGNPLQRVLENFSCAQKGQPPPPLFEVANFRQNPMTSHFVETPPPPWGEPETVEAGRVGALGAHTAVREGGRDGLGVKERSVKADGGGSWLVGPRGSVVGSGWGGQGGGGGVRCLVRGWEVECAEAGG